MTAKPIHNKTFQFTNSQMKQMTGVSQAREASPSPHLAGMSSEGHPLALRTDTSILQKQRVFLQDQATHGRISLPSRSAGAFCAQATRGHPGRTCFRRQPPAPGNYLPGLQGAAWHSSLGGRRMHLCTTLVLSSGGKV